MFKFKAFDLVVCITKSWLPTDSEYVNVQLDYNSIPQFGEICCITEIENDILLLSNYKKYTFSSNDFIPFELYTQLKVYKDNVSINEVKSFNPLNYEDIVYENVQILKSSLS